MAKGMAGLRYLAVFAFVAGASLLVIGLTRDRPPAASESSPPGFDLRPTVAGDAATETGTAPVSASPEPTATPFDGPIARMKIPAIGVDNPIEEIGLVDNTLDVPKDANRNIGWYYPYPRPGEGKNAVFAAHKNFDFKDGPFADLDQLLPGSEVIVEMEDGPTYVYKVIFYQRYNVDSMPTGELIAAPQKPANAEWVTLITCGGLFQATQPNGLGHYLERDVVIAQRVK
jgi:LPXTG-site transpeptidase (sortase) family protein